MIQRSVISTSKSTYVLLILTHIAFTRLAAPEEPPGYCLCFDIRSSHHDFGPPSWNEEGTCNPCHVPDGETSAGHAQWGADGISTFDAYGTNQSLFRGPSGRSRLCLSCHDGVYGRAMDESHPVSVQYDSRAAVMHRNLRDPETTVTALGGSIAIDLLENGTSVGCSSCHDVHLNRNDLGCDGCHTSNGIRQLSLRISNQRSGLCLTCHQ